MKSDQTVSGKNLVTTPIAIIGMASIFPQARTLPEYWNNILSKLDAIIDVPESRWIIDEYYDPDPAAPDKTYCKRGGFIPDVDFDPTEFGLPPNILEATDVSQLLSLLVARECLEDAGYNADRDFSRDRTGVILGMVGIGSKLVIPMMARLQYPVWEKVLRSYGISEEDIQQIIHKIKLAYPAWEENSFPGSIGNVVAGRIANRLDLGGTNCVVDAACASSLAALRMAVSELIEGRADMMISGGVDTDNSIGTYMSFSKTPAFSKGERVRPFDQDSDGMMVGEGIGMVLLKRLADAQRDGDRVYAVIKGIGSSSDGRYKSIYAPRPSGQSEALNRAYQEAGYEPATVGLIEAHGTGTMAGDPAEFEGLREVFSKDNPRRQHVALGSIKSQIGHTKAAAGVASLIKVSLALYHKILPPTINVTKPHPKFNIENSPFYLNTEARPWIKPAAYPRRASLSGFGFGGTNFHVAMEENQSEQDDRYRLNTPARVILISAPNPAELIAKCQALSADLQYKNGDQVFADLASASIENKVTKEEARVGFTAADAAEASRQLSAAIELIKNAAEGENAENPAGIYYRKSAMDLKGKLVALFPGQGSQYINMGRELAMNFPPIRQAFAEMDAFFDEQDGSSLSEVVYPIPAFDQAAIDRQNQRLTSTEYAQPAIGTLSSGIYKLFRQAGFKADFAAGHSFGELTALWAAGVLDDKAFYTLAKARGKAMAPPDDPAFEAGTMLAVKGDINQLRKDLEAFPDITLANWNSNNQVALAGARSAAAEAQQALAGKGYSVVPLPVSAAFHTPLVAHAHRPFAGAVQEVKFNKPSAAVYSNTSGEQYPGDPDQIRQVLQDHILKPVLFKDEIETIYAAGGMVFVEFGPRNILTNLVHNILEGKPHTAVAVNPNPKKDSDRQLRDAIAQLCVLGLDLRSFDPYAIPIDQVPARKKSAVTVTLNGGLYLTEKTRSAFKEAIAGQNRLSNSPEVPDQIHAPETRKSPEVNVTASPSQKSDDSVPSEIVRQVQIFQSEALKVHNQFLLNDGEYGRGFTRLVQQQLELLAANPAPESLEHIKGVLQTIEQSFNQFHQHQAETLQVHQQYLKDQAELTEGMLQILRMSSSSTPANAKPGMVVTGEAEPQPAKQGPATAAIMDGHDQVLGQAEPLPVNHAHAPQPFRLSQEQTGPVLDIEKLNQDLLELVSEKTGYPAEMLELDMDMEADLGIDSIKRVEIMGALQAQYPDLPVIDASALAEMRTLGEVADYMKVLRSSLTTADEGGKEKAQNQAAGESDMPGVGSTPNTILAELTDGLLQIVSDKTGYPTEMLELDMDMEADLGIDSIKRVEIMGALQSKYPDLPPFEASVLGDMHTLGQIVDFINDSTGTPSEPLLEKVQEIQDNIDSIQVPTSAEFLDKVDLEQTTHALLQIVSEKTGYPVEMLELDMDMEADLGIDSIKRVEIMGAMQASFPGLAQVDASQIGEMHTLSQIIASLAVPDFTDAAQIDGTTVEDEISPGGVSGLPYGVVTLKKVPEPDFLEMPVMAGYICLLTDDGSALTVNLAEKLAEEGRQVVILQLPLNHGDERKLAENIPSVQLADWDETTIQTTLAVIQDKYGPVAVFIHLDPAASLAGNDSEQELKVLKTTFLIAKYLSEMLQNAARDGFAGFMTVTRLDGKIGLLGSGAAQPESGSLFGLVKTLNLEWDRVFCRAVDIDPVMDAQTAAGLIYAELHDPNRLISEISHHSDGRYTLDLDQIAGKV